MTDQRGFFDGRPKPIVLRPYQQAAREAVWSHMRTRDDNPCVVIPTAGGKTPLMAALCDDAVKQWSARIVLLAHVKELLEQAADKLRTMCQGVSVGVYSAGLGRREVRKSVTVAGIQSIYRKACDLDPFDLAFVDEAQLITPEGDGMYRQFLADAKIVNPNLRVVGFTATPFRMKSGSICTRDGILNHICYEVGVRDLIVDGFLAPLITKAGQARIETAGLRLSAGEFVAEQVEALADTDELVREACAEIATYTRDRKSCLVFCCGVKHAEHVAAGLTAATGVRAEIITGDTPAPQRDRTLNEFRDGKIKYIVNVNVLTVGFDAPNIDCVALVRPTNSPGLYYQMVGRGFRLHPGKDNCLVLDFGGNVLRHGPVDRIQIKDEQSRGKGGEAPAKECPKCHAVIACGYSVCPDCGYEFPPPEKQQHDGRATNAGILSGQVTIEDFAVERIFYSVHTKRGSAETDPRTLRVDYVVGNLQTKSEWVCVEHPEGSFPRRKAEAWWAERSPDPFPGSADEAAAIANGGGFRDVTSIRVRTVAGETFERITGYAYGDMPEALPAGFARVDVRYSDDDIPF